MVSALIFIWGCFISALCPVLFTQAQIEPEDRTRRFIKPSLERLHVLKVDNRSVAGHAKFDGITLNIYPHMLVKREPCKTNPCKNGGVCQAINGGRDYSCACKRPFGGKHCGETVCQLSTTCFRYQDTFFYIFPFVPSNFTQSKTHCESLNMTMAMLKDNATHTAVKTKFLDLFRDRPDAKHAYWIGLSRNSTASNWTWVDGTALNYSRWASGYPGDNLCANIANGPRLLFDFDDDACGGVSPWRYFPLCQQTLYTN